MLYAQLQHGEGREKASDLPVPLFLAPVNEPVGKRLDRAALFLFAEHAHLPEGDHALKIGGVLLFRNVRARNDAEARFAAPFHGVELVSFPRAVKEQGISFQRVIERHGIGVPAVAEQGEHAVFPLPQDLPAPLRRERLFFSAQFSELTLLLKKTPP